MKPQMRYIIIFSTLICFVVHCGQPSSPSNHSQTTQEETSPKKLNEIEVFRSNLSFDSLKEGIKPASQDEAFWKHPLFLSGAFVSVVGLGTYLGFNPKIFSNNAKKFRLKADPDLFRHPRTPPFANQKLLPAARHLPNPKILVESLSDLPTDTPSILITPKIKDLKTADFFRDSYNQLAILENNRLGLRFFADDLTEARFIGNIPETFSDIGDWDIDLPVYIKSLKDIEIHPGANFEIGGGKVQIGKFFNGTDHSSIFSATVDGQGVLVKVTEKASIKNNGAKEFWANQFANIHAPKIAGKVFKAFHTSGDSAVQIIQKYEPFEYRSKDQITDLLEGLKELARRGLFHRDIKPSNLVMTPKAKTILIDWGSAGAERSGGRTPLFSGNGFEGEVAEVAAVGRTFISIKLEEKFTSLFKEVVDKALLDDAENLRAAYWVSYPNTPFLDEYDFVNLDFFNNLKFITKQKEVLIKYAKDQGMSVAEVIKTDSFPYKFVKYKQQFGLGVTSTEDHFKVLEEYLSNDLTEIDRALFKMAAGEIPTLEQAHKLLKEIP